MQKQKIQIEIIDSSTRAPTEYLTGSNFDGLGPSVKSLPSSNITQTFCVAIPICLKVRATFSSGDDSLDIQLLTRAAFEIIDPITSTVIVSASGSGEIVEFCLSTCPPHEPFNYILGRCVACSAGSFANAISAKCEICQSTTYSDVVGSVECITCPSIRPFSHKGASSLEECMTLAGNLYVSNERSRITQYSHDDDTHVIVLDEDGILGQANV